MSIVRASGLIKIYAQGDERVAALDGVDLRVAAGEFVLVAGTSGSGKTTLLNLIGGLDRPSAGELQVDGRDLIRAREEDLTIFRRDRIGFVFQDFRLLGHLTTLENVTMPLIFSGRHDRVGHGRALLERFGLGERLGHRPDDLSRGEMQRVALARALIHNPALLLADEPTGNLDALNSRLIWDHLAELHATGQVTIIATSHDPGRQVRAGRVVTLQGGGIVADRKLRIVS